MSLALTNPPVTVKTARKFLQLSASGVCAASKGVAKTYAPIIFSSRKPAMENVGIRVNKRASHIWRKSSKTNSEGRNTQWSIIKEMTEKRFANPFANVWVKWLIVARSVAVPVPSMPASMITKRFATNVHGSFALLDGSSSVPCCGQPSYVWSCCGSWSGG